MAAVAEQLGNLGQQSRAALAEAERIDRMLAASEQALADDRATLAELTERLDRGQRRPGRRRRALPGRARRGGARRRGRRARAEVEARLAVRTERGARAGHRRACRAAGAGGRERAHGPAPRRRAPGAPRPRGGAWPRRSPRAARVALARLDASRRRGRRGAHAAEQARAASDAELLRAARPDPRAGRRARAAHRRRCTATRWPAPSSACGSRTLGQPRDGASSASRPRRSSPSTAPTSSCRRRCAHPATTWTRTRPSRRRTRTTAPSRSGGCRPAERDLALLGKVNPLALEEFAALEERHHFLTEQLEDLKRSRKDLLDVVNDVDDRDPARCSPRPTPTSPREFEQVFARLFPGGEGRLVLTDPDDMLTTGIEVEARPPGKKVKRLSLLSGGERSLTAVALLVAIFQARPSPFYVHGRGRGRARRRQPRPAARRCSRSCARRSQLIVITHQKRTMEIADALYGVSMRGDGVTTVISQRLREDARRARRRRRQERARRTGARRPDELVASLSRTPCHPRRAGPTLYGWSAGASAALWRPQW